MKIEEVIHETRGHVMCRLIKEASFDEWLNYLFDRPECDYGHHWCFNDEGPVWDVPNELSAEFIARTYEESEHWMRRFSIPQIAAGLRYTWNPTCSNVVFAIRHEPVPWPLRQRAIRALVPLYQHCYQNLCERGLSHLGECLDNPLNEVCYMYWDVCPFYGQPEKRENHALDKECLGVMEATLQIDHDACRESALHGLGHWALAYPSRASSIIEQELNPLRDQLRPELWVYAENAKMGNVQ